MRHRSVIIVAAACGALVFQTFKTFGEGPGASFDISGRYKVVYPLASKEPQTNDFDFSLLSKPPFWQLSMTSSNRNAKVFSSPKQTFEVTVYDVPVTGEMNTAYMKIFPGSQPLSDRDVEHVWLALLSGDEFLGRNLPVRNPGLGMIEPSVVTEMKGEAEDASPRYMRWRNEASNGRTVRVEGEFRWLSNTGTIGGKNIPNDSQMTTYLVDETGKKKLLSSSELVILRVKSSSSTPIQVPRFPGRNLVVDYRSRDVSQPDVFSSSEQYTSMDGVGLESPPQSLITLAMANQGTKGGASYDSNIYDESLDGFQQISSALELAKIAQKHVLLQFGANWCGWCRMLHKLFEADRSVAETLRNDYVVVMIDVNNGHNEKVDLSYGHPTRLGLPVLVVLDADGRQLMTEGSGKLVDMDHYGHDQVLDFLKTWAPEKKR